MFVQHICSFSSFSALHRGCRCIFELVLSLLARNGCLPFVVRSAGILETWPCIFCFLPVHGLWIVELRLHYKAASHSVWMIIPEWNSNENASSAFTHKIHHIIITEMMYDCCYIPLQVCRPMFYLRFKQTDFVLFTPFMGWDELPTFSLVFCHVRILLLCVNQSCPLWLSSIITTLSCKWRHACEYFTPNVTKVHSRFSLALYGKHCFICSTCHAQDKTKWMGNTCFSYSRWQMRWWTLLIFIYVCALTISLTATDNFTYWRFKGRPQKFLWAHETMQSYRVYLLLVLALPLKHFMCTKKSWMFPLKKDVLLFVVPLVLCDFVRISHKNHNFVLKIAIAFMQTLMATMVNM